MRLNAIPPECCERRPLRAGIQISRIIAMLCVLVYLPQTLYAAVGPNWIEQWGITWTFDKNISTNGTAGTYHYGTFANGDYWVVATGTPTVVRITDISPRSLVDNGTTRHGTMVNPQSGDVNPNYGSGDHTFQGFDSRLYCYDVSFNKGRPGGNDISTINPMIVSPGSSIVSAMSRQGDWSWATKEMCLLTAAVLTVLDEAPPADSFRPGYCGEDKTVKFTAADLDYSKLGRYLLSGTTPPLVQGTGAHGVNDTEYQADTWERMVERPWLDFAYNTGGSYMHPQYNIQPDGAWLTGQVSQIALVLNSSNYTNEQKRKLLIRFVQVGIDNYSIHQGTNVAWNTWCCSGQIGPGRKFPILFAGMVLNDNVMSGIGQYSVDGIPERDGERVNFAEDEQTFYVTQYDIDHYSPTPVPPQETRLPMNDSVVEYYTNDHLNMPEWGILHYDRPRYDNLNWAGAPYRTTNGQYWGGFILAARMMNMKTLWNHNALFDYMDRYLTLSPNDQNPSWIAAAWATHRSGLGPVWPDTEPEDTVPPLPPTNLTSSNQTQTSITLNWTAPGAASDGDVPVSYRIYRNGSFTGSASTVSYQDTGLSSNTTYTYQVFSVDNAGNESDTAPSQSFSTTADTSTPFIVSVTAHSPVHIVFSESLNPATVTTIANYSITPGITIHSATLDTDQLTVILDTSAHENGEQYTLTVNGVKDLAGNTVVNATYSYVYSNGLVGFWKFSETTGTSAADSSGQGNTGLLINAPSVEWTYGGPVHFQGNTAAVQIPTTGMDVNSGTIALWANLENSTTETTYLIGHTLGSWSNRIQLYCYNRVLGLGLGSSHSVNGNITTLNLNTWYHIALTWNGTNYAVYINGTLQAAGTYSGLSDLETIADIGNDGNPSVRTEGMNGFIDDVCIYNNALSATDIQAIYENNAPPLAHAGTDQSVVEGDPLTLNASASSDPDGNISDYFWYEGTTLLTEGQSPTISPAAGTHTITLYVKDTGGLMNMDTVVVTVNPGSSNQAPTAQNQNITMNEDTDRTITLTGNDADGDTLSYILVSPPNHGSLSGVPPTINYDADLNYHGSDSLTFKVNDGTVDSNIATVAITVASVNDSPVLAAIGNRSTEIDTTLTFSISATDPDGDTITYQAQGLPTGASFVGQTFSWTPGAAMAGSHNVIFIANDSQLQDFETVTITVNEGQNHAPVLNALTNKSVNENGSLTFVVGATDEDNDTLTFWVQNLPDEADFTGATFTWNPDYNDAGSYSVTFYVSDGELQDSQTISITVNNVNRPPVLAALTNKTGTENSLLTFSVSATDPDNDPITYSIQNLPDGATYINHVFRWTPDFDDAGTYTVTFIASDGSLQDDQTITVTINNFNRPPVLDDIGNKSVNENALLAFTIQASDPDGDNVTYSAQNLPTGASFSNQTFSWTPSFDQAGYHQVTFIANDSALQDSETITISVGHVNQIPVLNAIGNKTIGENTLLSFTISATDPDDDPITYSAQNLPNGAALSNQNFSWTPTYDQAGEYTVTFIAADAQQQDSETLTITVINVNRTPVFITQNNKTVNENQMLSFSVEATDPDGDEIIYTAQQLPDGASLTDRFFQWTPGYDDAGAFSVTFIASDGDLQDAQTLAITVNNVNRPPVFDYIGNKTTNTNTSLSFTIHATDSDGDALNYSAGSLPAGASFSGQTFSWTPTQDQDGYYSVTFTAADASLQTQQTITITVGDINQVPTLMPISNKTVNENNPLSFFITGTDPDDDPLSYSAQDLPDGAAFADRIFNWTPTFDQAGVYSVTFIVNDGRQQDSKTISITVNNVNRPPVLDAIANQITKPTFHLSFGVSGSDPDGDIISFTAVNLPPGASFNNQTFSWTPSGYNIGEYQVTFVISDPQSQDTQTITIVVNEYLNNQAPVFDPVANKTVNENQLLTFTVNAVDPDDDPITYAAIHLPSGATFMNQTFTWTPTYTAAGAYAITFTANDGTLEGTLTVNMTVNNVNRSPVLNPISDQTFTVDNLLSFLVTATDPDGDTVTCSASALPSGSTFANNIFQWTPASAQPSSFTVTFAATDGQLETSRTITLSLAVPVEDTTPPIVANCIPKNDAIQIPVNSLIILNVTDDGEGVDPASVAIYVNNNLVYQGDSYNYASDFGRCKRKGKNDSYLYTYQPTEMYDYDQPVSVSVQACDLAGNQMDNFQNQFATEMYTFSVNTPVSITSSDIAQARPVTAKDSQGNIWIAWEVGPAGARDIYLNVKSADTGQFQSPVRITADPADQCHPAIAVDHNGIAFLTWQDNRRGNWDIHVCSSLDGTTWLDETRITESNDNQTHPAMAVDQNNTVWIAWQDDSAGHQDLYIASSSDRFANGVVAPVCTASADQTEPDLAVDAQNHVYLAWTDERNGSKDIYAATNQNAWANVALVKQPNQQHSPKLALDPLSNAIHLVWVDNTSGNDDIYYGSAANLGAAPLTGRNIIDDSSATEQSSPSIVISDLNNRLKVYVCWKDYRNALGDSNDLDVYFAEVLNSSGTNILATDSFTTANQLDPTMGINLKGEPYLVWIDDRNGNADVYYSQLFTLNGDLMALGDICAADGGLIGTNPDQITNDDDVSVQVPQQAFWTDVLLTITRLDNPLAIISSGFVSAYEFSPSSDMEFSQPVTITIPYTVSDPDATVSVCWYNPQTGTFSQSGISNIEYISITPTLRAIQFKTTHFSQYVITDESQSATGSAGGGGGGGCSMSRYEQNNAGIFGFLTPYLLLAFIMVFIKRRDAVRG